VVEDERMSLPTPADIIGAACHICGTDMNGLYSNSRSKELVLTRELITAALRRFRGDVSSFPCIARAMGRSSHSSVVLAWQRFQATEWAPVAIGNGPETTRHALVCRVWDIARREVARRVVQPIAPAEPAPPQVRFVSCPCCQGKGRVRKETADVFTQMSAAVSSAAA